MEGLNRNLENRQELTRDLDIGGLDASVTVDHRLLSSEGRDSIVNDAVDTVEHGQDLIKQLFARKRGYRVGLARAVQLSDLRFQGRHHSGLDDARNIGRLIDHDDLLREAVMKTL